MGSYQPKKTDKRTIWYKKDINIKSPTIQARLDGILQVYDQMTPVIVFYLVIIHNNTEYRCSIWHKTTQETDVTEVAKTHKDKAEYFVKKYDDADAISLIDMFQKKTSNVTYKAVMSNLAKL